MPLPITLAAESSPTMPNAVAALIGEKPMPTKKATSCTTIENIPVAVKKNTWIRPQNTGERSAARSVQPSPAFGFASPERAGCPAANVFHGRPSTTSGASSSIAVPRMR